MQEAAPSHVSQLPFNNCESNSNYPKSLSHTLVSQQLDIDRYLSRYLAGDSCLRESRNVSRKRLSLVASGLPNMDQDAYKLYEQQQRYLKAMQLLESSNAITLDILCEANAILTPEEKGVGKLRTKNLFMGESRKQATYVPPSFSTLPNLMRNLEKFIST